MARTKRVLSGAAKDAFLKRLLAAESGLDDAARNRLTKHLQDAIALLAVRIDPARAKAMPVALPSRPFTEDTNTATTATPCEADRRVAANEPFDPFSPNVIVVFRTRGRDALLAELQPIDDVESLRLLAREQQLGIAADLADPCDIRQAIVAAAERRIANRRAAAS